MGIPHVATLYAVQDDFAWQEGRPGFQHCALVQSDCLRYVRRWGQLLQTPYFVSRDTAPESLFRLGQERYLRTLGNPPVAGIGDPGAAAGNPPSAMAATAQPAAIAKPAASAPLRLVATGTFQERKQQLETIEAAGRLKKEGHEFRLAFYGYTHFFPEYLEKCRRAIQTWHLEEWVTIHDFTEDLETVLGQADALLSLSTYESFPGSIKDALAAGVPVAATPVGGVSELIVDSVTGILCPDTSVEGLVTGMRRLLRLPAEQRREMAEQGRRLARLELHPYRTANDLFGMYNQALACISTPPPVSAVSNPAASARVRKIASQSRSARVDAPVSPPVSLFPIGAGAIYRVQPARANWCGLDLMLEPHGRPVSGKLSVRISTLDGNLLRQAGCELNNFREAGWAELRFEPIKNTAGRVLQVEVGFHSLPSGAVLSLYQSTPPVHRLLRMVNRGLRRAGVRLLGGGLHCQLWYP
jgi:hypothetical protein